MKLKNLIRITGTVLAVAIASSAYAGGVTVAKDGDSKLKLGGKIFADVTNFVEEDATGATVKETTGARIERGYFTAKYYFDSNWMMRITTDVSLQKNLNSKNNNIFLKYAYLEGKLMGDAVVLRLGQSHTPWIDYEQGLWKHRYQSKVLIDTQGYDASSDLGVGLKGKLADGMMKYWVTYTNGAGYSHPEVTGDTLDLDARVGFYPLEGLTLDFQYRNGYKGTKKTPAVLASETKSTLYQVMATYGMGKDFRIGGNFAHNKVDPTLGTAVSEDAYAVWGWYNINSDFGLFGRYEQTTDDKVIETQEDRFAGGIEWHPTKHVTLALAYDQTETELGGATTSKKTRYGLYTETKF
ncbi:MAG: hypothetical protein R8K54_02310 [Mariprofundaceae bacterium]